VILGCITCLALGRYRIVLSAEGFEKQAAGTAEPAPKPSLASPNGFER
jgi:hypothetical protein